MTIPKFQAVELGVDPEPEVAVEPAAVSVKNPNPDPFDLDQLVLDQSFTETVGVRKLLTTVPARKPNPQDFMRVNPDPAYRANFSMIDLKDERELYLVPKRMAPELISECIPFTLFTAINRQGITRIWPVRLPGPDGKINEWWRTAGEAAELAMKSWIRIKANMDLGAYEMFVAESTISDPVWPELPFQELLRIAFKDRYIDSIDHPVVKRLRGLS
jgi:hypothetical protein